MEATEWKQGEQLGGSGRSLHRKWLWGDQNESCEGREKWLDLGFILKLKLRTYW